MKEFKRKKKIEPNQIEVSKIGMLLEFANNNNGCINIRNYTYTLASEIRIRSVYFFAFEMKSVAETPHRKR